MTRASNRHTTGNNKQSEAGWNHRPALEDAQWTHMPAARQQPHPDTKEGRPRVFVAAGLGGRQTHADHRSTRGSLGSMAHPGNALRIHPGLQGEAALSISLSGAAYFIEGYTLTVGSL